MIQTIIHTDLKGFFFSRKALPASLKLKTEGFCYWLSVLNAATCSDDLNLAHSRLSRTRSGYKLTVEDFGEFTFLITKQGIEKINFKNS